MDTNTIIGLIVGVTAIAVQLYLFYFGNKKKILVFEELQNLSVVDIKRDYKDKIEIKYAGKSVDSLYVLTGRITNKGNLPIRDNDVVEPIKFTFNNEILECNVTEIKPEELKITPNIISEGYSVKCEFNLLNPGAFFTLQFFSFEKLSTPKISALIGDLPKIDIASNVYQKSYKNFKLTRRNKVSIILLILLFLFIYLIFQNTMIILLLVGYLILLLILKFVGNQVRNYIAEDGIND